MEKENIQKKSEKVTEAGHPCRHCGTPVIRFKTKDKPRGRRAYYFTHYLKCPKNGCGITYQEPAAKKFWSEN